MRSTIGSGVLGVLVGVVFTAAALLVGSALGSSAGHDESGEAPQAHSLEERVARLEEQVARLNQLKPTFAAFMPQFSERFHVMHRAGDAQDWQVAKHEVAELQRLVEVSSAVNAERGQLFKSFMTEPLSRINEAIEHENRELFLERLGSAIENCNACHKAAGSPFIRVTLDVPSGVSMRHAHEFLQSSVEEMEHTH